MPLVEAPGDPPSAHVITAARAALAAGGVVGLPTDTVYGLAVDPGVAGATDALFALKGRPTATALPVLVSGVDQADRLGDLSDGAHALARSLWPGGLTLVVGRRPGVSMELGGRSDRIGLRCPAHPVPLELCRQSGPLAATSANRHGEADLASASEVAETFPGLLVLDGGECRGVSSTVVDATEDEPRLIRAGAVPWEEVLAAWA